MKVAGKNIQIDLSGIGTYWVDATEDNLPTSIQAEIALLIVSCGIVEDDCYVASNGLRYRW